MQRTDVTESVLALPAVKARNVIGVAQTPHSRHRESRASEDLDGGPPVDLNEHDRVVRF
jgi:hypothetical protein